MNFDDVITFILGGVLLWALKRLVDIVARPPIRTFHVHVALKPTINDLYVNHENICTIYTCRAPEIMSKIEEDMLKLKFTNHRPHILKVSRL